jgi:hypothetical protein
MDKLGYKLMAEEHGPDGPGLQHDPCRAGRVRLRGDFRPFLSVADGRNGGFEVSPEWWPIDRRRTRTKAPPPSVTRQHCNSWNG